MRPVPQRVHVPGKAAQPGPLDLADVAVRGVKVAAENDDRHATRADGLQGGDCGLNMVAGDPNVVTERDGIAPQ